MKAGGPRTRPGLVIRRTFQPDLHRAAAALAQLLAAQDGESAGEPAGGGRADHLQEVRCEDWARLPRASIGQAIGRQRDRGRRPAPPPGRTPAGQG